MKNIIPLPTSIVPVAGFFEITPATVLCPEPGAEEALHVAEFLAEHLRLVTGFPLPIRTSTVPKDSIILAISNTAPSLGEEGYHLDITPDWITVRASKAAGLFHGVQTLLQCLPASVETGKQQPGPWRLEAGTIRDQPRFAWRGSMLDVARHFFTPAEVKRYIDQLASYKFNILHLHLTDDQGWRLMIHTWPRLAEVGGSTAVNGDRGGFYTQAEYREIVEYARRRFITIIPEVDLPGHTGAALASYAALNSSGVAPALYTGTEVGFSSLDVRKEITYRFLEDVLGEIAALTPGPYLHIGGDEAHSTPETDYVHFIRRLQRLVKSLGKTLVGWEEIARAGLPPVSVVQFWQKKEWAQRGAAQGHKIVLSPAVYTYMDMKYNADTQLGLIWTKKYNEVRDAYEWDPGTLLEGVGEESILGIEAPLWSETTVTTADLDYMIFPRLPGYAELGWSAAAGRSWEEYRRRLASHGPRWEARGIKFYRSPQVEWEK